MKQKMQPFFMVRCLFTPTNCMSPHLDMTFVTKLEYHLKPLFFVKSGAKFQCNGT